MNNNINLEVSVMIEIKQEAEDCFTATCPQLGSIFVQEETKESAIFYVIEAIGMYLKMSAKHGDPIPEDIVISQEISADTPKWHPVTKLNLTTDYIVPAVV